MAWLWIVAVVLLVVLIAIGLMAIFTRTTSKSRGGVEHGDVRHRGDPPFESIDR
jgi:flagellar basal body-associated protein FliL